MVLTDEGEATVSAGEDTAGNGSSERTRQIVRAAYELLDEAGLEGLTIRAVLTRTGLSRRAFYERFGGKDDLVLAVFEQTIKDAVTHFSHLVEDLAGPLERLELIVASIVIGRGTESEAANRRGAALSREHLRLAEARPDELQSAVHPLVMLIARHLADGMAKGAVRRDDPQKLAALIYNLVSSTTHMELLTEETGHAERSRRADLAAEIWEFCRRAIVA